MKKVLILASLIAFTSMGVMAAETAAPKDLPKPPCKEQLKKMPPKQHVNFEKRLKLTDEQKVQAKEIRIKGHEDIKPLVDQSIAKKKELKAAIAENKDYQSVEKLKKELRSLERQKRDLQMKNMKEFESILTKKQKKELDKIKKEGRKNFDKNFKKQGPPRHGMPVEPKPLPEEK